MTEQSVLRSLIWAALVLPAVLLLWFLFQIRPRSIAVRIAGAGVTALLACSTLFFSGALMLVSEAHARVDSEVDTFLYFLSAVSVLIAGAALSIPAAVVWGFGIHAHPQPVSRLERGLQRASLLVGCGVVVVFLGVMGVNALQRLLESGAQ